MVYTKQKDSRKEAYNPGKGCQGQGCRPAQGWTGLKDHRCAIMD